jgi:signal transduction histidine kinase
VRWASSPFTEGMRAVGQAWPLGGGTIGYVSTTFPPGRLRGHELLAAVAEGTAGTVGDEFLRCLAQHVAEAFAAKMVLICEADDPSGMHVRTLVSWYDGAFIDEPFSYDTAGTPCAVMTDYPWVAFPEALSERFPKAEIAINLGLQSYVAVCLKSSDDVHLGHLAVLDTRPMEAGEEDAAALRIFAARASAELERRNQAEALAASRARVIEAADKERRRVGRDLHDGAQQRLLAVSNLLRVSRMKLDEGDPAYDLVARAEEELTQAHAELRKLARGLHPVALRERGLGQALASLCQASDVPIEVDVYEGELPLPVARGAYFVAAESLANAARYAQASKIEVRIAKQGQALVVEVSDDGVGGADIEKGTGLLGLSDRVDVLGGRLAVDSPAGGGTRIRATIPMSVPRPEASSPLHS